MIGSQQRMPKRFRYPLFLAGLVILVLGSLIENAEKASVSTYEATAILGFALLVASVLIK